MKSFLMMLVFAAPLFFGSTAKADSQITNLNDPELACDDTTDQCVIFEVVIHMNTSVSSPIVRSRSDVLVIGNSYNPYGSVVRRSADKCSKEVRVPRPVYEAIMQIMRSLYDSSGSPGPALTPAQQTILLFYTTIMQQTLQFRCSDEDVGA